MDSNSERLESYPGLAAWWRRAEEHWLEKRASERLSLLEQLNYQGKLASQFPISNHRIIYNGSGMHLAAARLSDTRAVLSHKLYWATAESDEEALYLCAILNAAVTTELVRPLMSYGKDERDIDKNIWKLPIPLYEAKDKRHARLAELGKVAEEAIAVLPLEDKHFAAVRRQIRGYLEQSEVGREIDELVRELLTGKKGSKATPTPPPVAVGEVAVEGMSFRHLANKLAKARESDDQEAMDLVVEQVDGWLLADQGQEVDKLVGALMGKKLTVGVNLAVLSAVHPRRQDLRAQEPPDPLEEAVYKPFFEQAEKQLKAQKRDTTKLLRAWR